jgi:hypothetical protein
MASGNQHEIINTRERVLSDDINRLQAFLGKHVAEMFRWMVSATMGEGGAGAVGSATTSPLSAVIFNGLWARPEIGTVNLFVEPGAIGMVNPDLSPSADDSAFKVFADAGVQVAGALTLTAGSGSTRIDVIECSRVDEVIEADNRDVFNIGTGLFTPTLVDKVARSRLSYRIRVGTPGGGFPGAASGWLPLAVASVPSTATTWDNCIVWDVRPLMMDLVRSPAQVSQVFPAHPKGYGTAFDSSGAGLWRLRGVFEAEFGSRRVGGEIASALSGLASGLFLAGTDVKESGFSVTNNLPWYVYAMFPHGLPRWARYSPSSSGQRVPLPFRGIPMLSQKPPANGQLQALNVAAALPADLGFTGTHTAGTPIATGAFDGSGNFIASAIAGGWTLLGGVPTAISPATGAGTNDLVYELADNTHLPVGCSMVRVRFTNLLTGTPVETGYKFTRTVRALDGASGITYEHVHRDNQTTAGGSITDIFELDIPLHALTNMPAGTPVTRRIGITYAILGGVSLTYSGQSAAVVGWRLGYD